jgi:ubiquinone/menaquinone biosynthesis C-methylase UbiE
MSSHERALNDEANNITYQRCQYAYEWSIPFITGKKVLDTGCGLGYGANFMSGYATEVVGIDYDRETIEQNKKSYSDKKNISFVEGTIPPLPFPDGTFDVVTSYHFIEHLNERKVFIGECIRILKPGGKLLLTTPNTKKSFARNPFHVHEYTFDEISKELNSFTKNIELLGLNGNEQVNKYYDENGKFVRMILKFDFLGLHKILPGKILQLPYNLLTSLMRNRLKEKITEAIHFTSKDFFLQKENLDECWDIFVVGGK